MVSRDEDKETMKSIVAIGVCIVFLCGLIAFVHEMACGIKQDVTENRMDQLTLADTVRSGLVMETKYLLSIGRDPNCVVNSLGESVLFEAISGAIPPTSNEIAIIKLLLMHGADPQFRRGDGMSVLELTKKRKLNLIVGLLDGKHETNRVSPWSQGSPQSTNEFQKLPGTENASADGSD
jgi:hypothetical protein